MVLPSIAIAEPKPSLFAAAACVIFFATRHAPLASARNTYTTPGP